MPPRRKAAKEAAPTIDLTLDSDSDAPPPAKKAVRASTRKGRGSTVVIEDDDDDSADRALAKQLQDEENARGDDDQVVMQDTPVASGSASNSRPRRNASRGTPSSSALVVDFSPGTAPSTPTDLSDPKALLLLHRDMFLAGRKCTCGGATADGAYTRPSLGDKNAGKAFFELGAVKCGKCRKSICRGCWEEDSGAEGVGKHCAEQRAVILYEVLAALDATYLVDRLKKPIVQVKAAAKGRKKAVKPIKGVGAGVGYGTDNHGGPMGGMPWGGGIGYDEFDSEDEAEYYEEFMDEYGYPPPPNPNMARAKAPAAVVAVVPPSHAKDLAEDKLFHCALSLITQILPHPDAADAGVYDYLPHPSLAPLLALSTVQDLLATLLRNDSVGEWTRRSELYFAVLGVLTALSESEPILGVLFGERWEKRWSTGLASWMEGRGELEWERKDPPVVVTKAKGRKRKSDVDDAPPSPGEAIMGPSLFSLLRRLVTQADAFRKAATTGDFNAGDIALLGLCGDMSAAGDRCVRTLKIWDEQRERDGDFLPAPQLDGPTNGKGKGRAIEDSQTYTDAQYASACRTLAYESLSLAAPTTSGTAGLAFPSHYYNKDIVASAASQRPHGGFVHLAKELAVLSTNLPPGIFLRVDEARIDVMKCIIAGPADTPYAGGLFEFDLFVPLQYPQVPPKVWLRTTGGGSVRFNPNLYAEGKVCLSIIGTWPGRPDEMWQPGSSTILQVLISIQAMILGTTMPYFNEPGFGAAKDSKPSKDYNSNVSLATVKHAILYWCQDQFKDGIWGDVIATHLTFNRPSITAQIKSWATKDKRMRSWSPSLNQLSGSHMLQAYGHDQQFYALAYQQALIAGQSHQAAAAAARAAKPPAVTAIGVDLLGEFEQAMDKVAGWRTQAFFKTAMA